MTLSRIAALLTVFGTLLVIAASCALCEPARRDIDMARVGVGLDRRDVGPLKSDSGTPVATMSEVDAGDGDGPDGRNPKVSRRVNAAAVDVQDGPLRTVSSVDLNRYMGKWYEIGRYPNPYQDGVVGVIAEYTLQDDGEILVRNYGRAGSLDADVTESTATAWVSDSTTNAKWYVQFFWPFKADYWIIDLDDAYQYAVVGQPERERLWILSRSPSLPAKTLEGIYKRLVLNGYDPALIELTPQVTSD